MENIEKTDSKETNTADNENVNNNETGGNEPVKREKEYLHWIKRNMTINANEETQALIADVLQKFDTEKQTASITQFIKNTCNWLLQQHAIITENKLIIRNIQKKISILQAQIAKEPTPVQEPTPTSTQEPTPTPTPVQAEKKTSYLNLLGF